MDPQPLVCFFGITDGDAVKKKYSTLTTLSYSNDSQLLSILKEKQPEFIISVGASWKDFPQLSSKLPAAYRKRWLHYSSLDELNENSLYNSWMSTIFNYELDPNSPLVSVFTTSYKSGDKILRPLRSLKAQTYTNWEWIIYDDTDPNSEEGIKNWTLLNSVAEQDHRIRIFRSNHNLGRIGASKFNAAQLCTGSLLVEVDHDDDLVPQCLQYIVDAAREYPEAGFFYSDCCELKEDGTTLSYGELWGLGYGAYYFEWYQGRWIIVERSPNLNPTTLHHIVAVPNHVRAWTRKCYHEIGGHCRSLPVVDDYELILRTVLSAEMVYIPRVTYLQYRNDDGNNFTLIRNAEIQKLVKHVDRYYSNKITARCKEICGSDRRTNGIRFWELDYRYVDPVIADVASVKETPLSVVISNPVSAADLEKCVTLLLTQSYTTFELLVVGDVSCKSFLKGVFSKTGKDPRVRWWQLEKDYKDGGLSARNYILRGLLRTDVVTYVSNSAEIISRDYLQNLMKNYKKYGEPNPADTVEGNSNKYYFISDSGVLIHHAGLLLDCGYWQTGISVEESQKDLLGRFDEKSEESSEDAVPTNENSDIQLRSRNAPLVDD